jgi:flavin reductase (DIM6/NTAB) family NADH-FMN oxidoreductase RutF
LRHAMGHFATGVTVITSIDADGQPVGTTANAVSSLSLDPPLLLVCFDRSSQTLAAIAAHGAFAVNVLAAPQEEVSSNFARRGLAANWDSVPHRKGPTGCPRLHGVLATLDCTVEHRLPGGDHEIVVGRVREVETANGEAAPLLFWHGRYASLERLSSGGLGDLLALQPEPLDLGVPAVVQGDPDGEVQVEAVPKRLLDGAGGDDLRVGGSDGPGVLGQGALRRDGDAGRGVGGGLGR